MSHPSWSIEVVQYAQAQTGVPARTGPVPAWATAASSRSGMLTEVARWNTVRPEAGWTKPTR